MMNRNQIVHLFVMALFAAVAGPVSTTNAVAQGLGSELKEFIPEGENISITTNDLGQVVYMEKISDGTNTLITAYLFDENYRCYAVKIAFPSHEKYQNYLAELTKDSKKLSDSLWLTPRTVILGSHLGGDWYVIGIYTSEGFLKMSGIKEAVIRKKLIKSVKDEEN